MTLSLTFAAVRRHPFSVALTAMFTIVTASLLGVPAPLALALWFGCALGCFELWYLAEPALLCRLTDCRRPTFSERERLEAAVGPASEAVLVDETPDLGFARGLRCIVISRDLLEVLDDRGLAGFINQAAARLQVANLAGLALVWLGNLPALGTWLVVALLAQLARLLALVVGASLVVPLVLWRDGFLRWAGRAFTCVGVALCGIALVSSGFAAAGLGLMLAWLIVPVVRALLGWESRRAERAADRATIQAGLGPHLLEAIDFLALAEFRPHATGLLKLLCTPGAALTERALHIRRDLDAKPPLE